MNRLKFQNYPEESYLMNKCKVMSLYFFNTQVKRGLRNGLDWMKFDETISKEVWNPYLFPTKATNGKV